MRVLFFILLFGSRLFTIGATWTIPVDPSKTFYRVVKDEAGAAEPISLAAFGISPGDLVRFERQGTFRFNSSIPFEGTAMVAVFSKSPELLPGFFLNRIPHALPTEYSFPSPPTLFDNKPTDIASDFYISDAYVTVPEGAAYIFISPVDVHFGDNLAGQAPFGLKITPFRQIAWRLRSV